MTISYINNIALRFRNLSDDQTPVFTISENDFPAFVMYLRITNVSNDIILINCAINNPTSGGAYIRYQQAIKVGETYTIALSDEGGGEYMDIGDDLLIYSNGYDQLFDCSILLNSLNEKNDII